MNPNFNMTAFAGYVKKLADGVNYAIDNKEIQEFSAAVTVIMSRIMAAEPRMLDVLEKVKDHIRKELEKPATRH
jgi:hypothetical protein